MRLWHIDLLDKLPKQWIQGQHKECCMLRGKNWNRKHSTVDYIKKYNLQKLYYYHLKVMFIAVKVHKVNISDEWFNVNYRGKNLPSEKLSVSLNDLTDYPEHDNKYLQECITNLKQKGIIL